MKLVDWIFRHKRLLVFSLVILFLSSCGGGETQPADENSRTRGGSPGEGAPTEIPQQVNTSGVEFEEGELPEDFPDEFPVHEDARIGSTIEMAGDNHFRVFLSFTMSLEEVLTYYHHELQAEGWTVESEQATSKGTLLKITNPEYEAKLDFITSEMGVVLDLTIDPLGEAFELPEIAEGIGESSGLGEGSGDFPADFPMPIQASPIPLSDKLRGEGYQLVFSFPEIPELALIQISTALMGGGWEIGDYEIDAMTHVYIVPFTDPGSGFQGFALLTDNLDVVGMNSVDGSIIALHPGTP